ncbi:hypothetical protein B0H17DRAFT_1207829 [Mycena rosella]|uniref:Uncharacterized protein n=1 Tax=Mycena rosella TaxID=1033263 RepID=A0AAD7GA54_MYCRO|nr:hypothetical protein B0H17DRAFT_1207829 [Mycena rosella]
MIKQYLANNHDNYKHAAQKERAAEAADTENWGVAGARNEEDVTGVDSEAEISSDADVDRVDTDVEVEAEAKVDGKDKEMDEENTFEMDEFQAITLDKFQAMEVDDEDTFFLSPVKFKSELKSKSQSKPKSRDVKAPTKTLKKRATPDMQQEPTPQPGKKMKTSGTLPVLLKQADLLDMCPASNCTDRYPKTCQHHFSNFSNSVSKDKNPKKEKAASNTLLKASEKKENLQVSEKKKPSTKNMKKKDKKPDPEHQLEPHKYGTRQFTKNTES